MRKKRRVQIEQIVQETIAEHALDYFDHEAAAVIANKLKKRLRNKRVAVKVERSKSNAPLFHIGIWHSSGEYTDCQFIVETESLDD